MKINCTDGGKISVDVVAEDGMCNGEPELCFTLQSGESFSLNVHEFNKIMYMFNRAFKEYKDE